MAKVPRNGIHLSFFVINVARKINWPGYGGRNFCIQLCQTTQQSHVDEVRKLNSWIWGEGKQLSCACCLGMLAGGGGWDCATTSTFLVEAAWVEPVGLVQANTWLCWYWKNWVISDNKRCFASKNLAVLLAVIGANNNEQPCDVNRLVAWSVWCETTVASCDLYCNMITVI